MGILLPLLAASLLFSLHRRSRYFRDAIIDTSILYSLLLFLCFESLSLFHALTAPWLITFWTAVSLLAAARIWQVRSQPILHAQRLPLSPADRILMTWMALIAATLLIAALIAPPNTWDVMSYHMPRVMSWIQNQSIAYYPTHISRQVESPPFAEYIIAQSQLLFGSDRLANLGQWFALLGSAIAASLISQRLGARRPGQLFATVACLTIPPALLEATGSKNDCLAAFWTLCATLKLLDLSSSNPPHLPWPTSLRAGVAIGLAMLTKGTFYFFGWPVITLLSILTLHRHRWRALPPLAAAAFIALTLNTPHFSRNLHYLHDLFGSPITHNSIENTHYTPSVIASNIIDNLAAQSATPSDWFNQHLLYAPAVHLYHWFSDSPTPFYVRWGHFHDDNTGGGAHIPLILFCLIATFLPASRRRHPLAAPLAISLILSFLTFCLLIKWQPWHGRYFILLFALCTPLIGLTLESLPRLLAYTIALLLLFLATPYILFNQTRPMIGPHNIFNTPRLEQYFASRQPSTFTPYQQAAKLIAATGATDIGLLSDYDAWPYPLRMVLQDQLHRPIRFDYLNGFYHYPPEKFKVRVPSLEHPAGQVLVVLPWWNWGTFQPTPKVLTDDTGVKFYVAADLGPIAVYTRSAAADISHKFFLESGWQDVDQTPAHWSAWTTGPVTATLCRTTPATLLLTGQIASAPLPNLVTIKLNGTEVATLPLNSHHLQPFAPIPLPLHAGDNLLQILSQQPADPFNHAILFSKLKLLNSSDNQTIDLEPIPLPKSRF